MKRPKIIAVTIAVVFLFSGVSMAYYTNACAPILKIELAKIPSLIASHKLSIENLITLITKESLKPMSSKIDKLSRLQDRVNRCL